jgi:hypothetical protein
MARSFRGLRVKAISLVGFFLLVRAVEPAPLVFVGNVSVLPTPIFRFERQWRRCYLRPWLPNIRIDVNTPPSCPLRHSSSSLPARTRNHLFCHLRHVCFCLLLQVPEHVRIVVGVLLVGLVLLPEITPRRHNFHVFFGHLPSHFHHERDLLACLGPIYLIKTAVFCDVLEAGNRLAVRSSHTICYVEHTYSTFGYIRHSFEVLHCTILNRLDGPLGLMEYAHTVGYFLKLLVHRCYHIIDYTL